MEYLGVTRDGVFYAAGGHDDMTSDNIQIHLG